MTEEQMQDLWAIYDTAVLDANRAAFDGRNVQGAMTRLFGLRDMLIDAIRQQSVEGGDARLSAEPSSEHSPGHASGE